MDIAHNDRRKTAQPIAIHHHTPARFARKGGFKVSGVNDSCILSRQTDMGSNQLLVSEQFNPAGMNPCCECPSHQVSWNRIPIRFNGDQPFAAHHHTIEKAVITGQSRQRSKFWLFFR